ncbi:MAG: hypothetical protein IJL26_00950 [Clostridia bacterium]|nr:hypothetical protein [Clostridia bacterium]
MNRLIFLSTFLFELLTGAFYFGVKFSPARRRWQTAASFIAVGALQYGISMLNMPYVNLTAFILCWFFIGVFVYALRIPAAAFHAGLLAAIMMSTEFVATFLLKLFVDIDMNDLFFGDTFNLMILSFMAKIVYFIGVYIASRFSVREKSVRILAPQTLPLLLLSAATLFVLSGMDETVKRYSPDRPLLLIFSLASGFLLYANLTVFAVHEYTIRL